MKNNCRYPTSREELGVFLGASAGLFFPCIYWHVRCDEESVGEVVYAPPV